MPGLHSGLQNSSKEIEAICKTERRRKWEIRIKKEIDDDFNFVCVPFGLVSGSSCSHSVAIWMSSIGTWPFMPFVYLEWFIFFSWRYYWFLAEYILEMSLFSNIHLSHASPLCTLFYYFIIFSLSSDSAPSSPGY